MDQTSCNYLYPIVSDVDECLAQEDLSDPEIIVIPDDIGQKLNLLIITVY